MSISDNEELDTKPPAPASARCHTMSTTTSSDNNTAVSNTNLQKTKQNNIDASTTSTQYKNSIIKKKKLTSKEQMEYSNKCVATLLSLDNNSSSTNDEVAFNNSISNKLDFGVMHLTNNHVNNSNQYKKDDKVEEIAVIPSLVSLSDSFFFQQQSSVVGSVENSVAAAASSSSSMNFATLNNTSTAAPTNTTNTTTSTAAGGQHNIQNLPSLRPRMSTTTSSSRQPYSILTGSGSNNMNGQGREGWPVGPQGAIVPSHLLDELDNVIQVAGGANQSSTSVAARASSGGLSNTSNHQTASLAQPPQPPPNSPSRSFITTNLTTNTFNHQSQSPGMNTNSPMGNRSRNVRERHAAGTSRLAEQQQREVREPIYINAVQSLELAVKKLEVKLKERKDAKVEAASQSAAISAANNTTAAGSGSSRISSASSGSPRRRATSSTAAAGVSGMGVEEKKTKTIEQLESSTLIKLANIMFHPPTGIVDGLQYTWDEDENDTSKEGVCTLAPPQFGQEDRDTDINESSFEEEVISEEVIMGGADGSKSMSLDESPPSPPTFKFKSNTLPPTTTTPNNRYLNIQSIQSSIIKLGLSIPTKRVCQYAFKKNDIVWVCRTCQSDETCVLCHECFSNSNHDGHDVSFYHASAGGCCDCGDADGQLLEAVSDADGTFYTTINCLMKLCYIDRHIKLNNYFITALYLVYVVVIVCCISYYESSKPSCLLCLPLNLFIFQQKTTRPSLDIPLLHHNIHLDSIKQQNTSLYIKEQCTAIKTYATDKLPRYHHHLLATLENLKNDINVTPHHVNQYYQPPPLHCHHLYCLYKVPHVVVTSKGVCTLTPLLHH